MVFSARRTGPSLIQVKMVGLWRRDGGFQADDDFGCGDDHDGDTEGMSFTVSTSQGSVWQARLEQYSDCSAEAGFVCETGHPGGMVDPEGPYQLTFSGTHPNLYPSAGKHHMYVFPARTLYDVEPIAGYCWDPHRGTGRIITPGETPGAQVLHVPAAMYDSCGETWDEESEQAFCHCSVDASWLNICRAAMGQQVPLGDGFQSNSLSNLGYSASITDQHFLSGETTGVWQILGSLQREVDQDGDGRPDLYSPGQVGGCRVLPPPRPPTAPTDLCPLGEDQSDPDGDGVYGACDPDPFYRNTYVGGGSAAWSAARDPEPSLSARDFWFTSTGSHPRGGFWDSDQDGRVEGEDLCPTVPGGGALGNPSANSNSWGEQLQFQDADGARDVGFLYRGNLCDPYPSTTTLWTETASVHQDPKCKPFPRYEHGGKDSYKAWVRVQAGRSANDPNRDAPDNRRFQVQPFRCSCPTGDEEDCLGRVTSPCFAERLQEGRATDEAGTFWRPVQRSGCTLDADGYCTPMTMPNSTATELSWNWVAELESHPDHFPVGTVSGRPALDPDPPGAPTGETEYVAGSYALWTATLEGESFSSAPGLAFSTPPDARFPEPERTDVGAVLADISRVESRRLRSSFAPPKQLVSGYVRRLPPGNECQPPPLLDPCEVASCNWPEWWNWLIYPPDLGRLGGLIQDWTPGDAWYWQRRGDRLEDTYLATAEISDLRARLEEPGHWSAGRPGHAALLNAGQAVPAIMFVEQSDDAAHWVLMEAVAQDSVEVLFTPVAEGQMPGAVTNQARLISDPRGQGAVLLDPELNAFFNFDFATRQWLSQDLPIEISELQASGIALSGAQLYVGPTASSPGWIVNVSSGKTASWAIPGVSRTDARLAPTVDGNGLLLAGGTDQAGPHDDVWLIPFGSGPAPVPTQLVSDSSTPNPRAATRALVGYSNGGPLLSVGSGDTGRGLDIKSSAGARWSPPTCPAPDLTRVAAFASSQLWIGAGARVRSHGSWAGVASQGDARIGVGAELGSITAEGGVSIGVGARLAGDVVASGSVVNRGVVAGQVRENTPVGLSGLDCFDVAFPPAAESVWVAPRATRTLAPSSYASAKIFPHGTLRLSAGSYFFKKLEALALSRVELDTRDGAIRIYVQDKLSTLGDWTNPTHGAERLLVGYFGATPLPLVRPFAGTLVAPRAAVLLANWQPDAFSGAFFASEISVLPGTQVELIPFRGEMLP